MSLLVEKPFDTNNFKKMVRELVITFKSKE
jgi:hypothetical protein